MVNFSMDLNQNPQASIKVVGVGGAGGNAINRMINSSLLGVDFIAVNTDLQVLEMSQTSNRIQIGTNLTKGLGAGANPEIGRLAAEESSEHIKAALEGADMVFITAGMGGGTGTGASPTIARVSRELEALTVAIVTKPFIFEGRRRMSAAMEGLKELRDDVDTLICIPNQRLLSVVESSTPLVEAFQFADEILLQASQGISDIINIPGYINVDFSDVRTIMAEMGDALMGTGLSRGEHRGREAAKKAISSPLLEDVTIAGAKGILLNISGGRDMTIEDIENASYVVHEEAGEEANIILGAVFDDSLEDQIRVTVIATGFNISHMPPKRRENHEEEILNIIDMAHNKPLDIEDPTFLRRGNNLTEEKKENEQVIVNHKSIKTYTPDDLEYPTFLRNQMD